MLVSLPVLCMLHLSLVKILIILYSGWRSAGTGAIKYYVTYIINMGMAGGPYGRYTWPCYMYVHHVHVNVMHL